MRPVILDLTDNLMKLMLQDDELAAKHLMELGIAPNTVIIPDTYNVPPTVIAGMNVIVAKKIDKPKVAFLLDRK